eukprot:CAMPEP_0202903444 /NCGR_PEP_ID=MMETSP1392-20130828/24466_1 /ASSEMBLY_ACC=CAM_ASM_000868 /TAXON_ID=225041 /ORGANISM="Chlamydomonas chlamydogama, Strain SAG 11-48b" /LENGTH=389 /DNA_ID=CAMNT_0049590625 /DNA_START=8 /DNA_END=1177 /DNA_ORIENTATION=+
MLFMVLLTALLRALEVSGDLTPAFVTKVLPPNLLEAPSRPDPGIPPLSGIIANPEELKLRPRVLVGYISDKEWAMIEFVAMTHASWRYITGLSKAKIDLLVFTHQKWAPQVNMICSNLELNEDVDKTFKGMLQDQSQCFVVSYPPPPQEIWHGYPFINNVHFFVDDRVASILKQHYGYVMKTDFDTFLTPAFLNFFPTKLTFGVQEYVVVDTTKQRLKDVSAKLGLTHKGRHNLGPTWVGDASTILTMANYSISVMYHIVKNEFPQLPTGGIAQRWNQGEGWPEWSAGIAAMYATEIAVNHMVKEFDSTDLMDAHGDTTKSVHQVIHIHCRHGDGDFSKFEFFNHHYDKADLTSLQPAIVKDYAMLLAVTTWRHLAGDPSSRQRQKEEL